jgi:succinoglycan biosynthesis transport protein ExoP
MEASTTQTATIGDYLGWLVRRWWIVALAVIIGGVGALAYVHTQPKSYDSVTPVLVTAPLGDGSKVDLDTEATIVKSVSVADGAKTLLRTPLTVTQLLKYVTVAVPANTSVLNITFEAATAAEAQQGSQQFAQAYLNQRNKSAQTTLAAQIKGLSDQITVLNGKSNTLQAQISAAAKGSSALATAQSQQQIVASQINTLTTRLAPLEAEAGSVNGGSILSPATLPNHPAKPTVPLYLVSGLAIGLLLGIAIALAMSRLDTRVYRVKDVPERPDVPVLMEFRPGRSRPSVADAATVLGREFSQLRNVLRFAAGSARGGRPSATDTLLICGAVPGPATGFVVANLAAAFARSGERVIIVGTDLDSTIGDVLGVRTPYGLGEVLAGEIALDDALQVVPSLKAVSILPSGQLDPRVELPVGAVTDLLQELQQKADRVLIACAPPSRSVDAQALSEVAAAVVLVVETHRVHAPEIDAALDQFSRVHAPVAGMLVVTDHWKNVKPAKWAVARPAARPNMPQPPAKKSAEVKRPGGDAPAPGTAKDVDGDALTAAPGGWRGRTLSDQTMVLPRAKDIEDPPTAAWPAGDEDDATITLVESQRTDSR